MKKANCTAFRAAAWSTGVCLAAAAQAGGHFDVDDAGMLDPGQCQYEAWGSRLGNKHPATHGLHVGPACRVGPVELGLGIDRIATRGERAVTYAAPQLKWTFDGQEADARLAAALSGGVVFDATRGGRAGGQFVIPVTWRASDALQVHVNLGADWAPGSGARTLRAGLQAEWAVDERVSLIAERNRASGFWTSRIGARLTFTPTISIDVSAARIGSEAGRLRGVVVGVNQTFGGR